MTNGKKINRDRKDGQVKETEKITAPPNRPDKTVWLTSLPTLVWSRGRPRRQQADEGVQGKAVASNAFPFPLFLKAGNLAL